MVGSLPAPPTHRWVRAIVWCIIALFPLYPLVPRFGLLGPLDTTDIIPTGCILLSAWGCAHPRARHHVVHALRTVLWPVAGPFAVFLCLATGAAMVSATSSVELARAGVAVGGRLLGYGVLVCAVVTLMRPRDRQRLLIAMVMVAVFEGLLGAASYAAEWRGPWGIGMLETGLSAAGESLGRVRVQGTFGGETPPDEPFLNRANFYSAYLCLSLMLLFFLWFNRHSHGLRANEGRGHHRWAWTWLAAAGLSLVLGIVVSQTRMSVLAAGTGAILLALLQGRWRVLLIFAVVTGSVVLATPSLRHQVLRARTDRLQQWQIAARVIVANPGLGVGHGRYLDEAERLGSGVDVPKIRTPHNSILLAAANYGVGAGIALIALFGSMLVAAWREWRRHRSSAAAVRLALVVVFVLHDQTNNLFFVPEVALTFWAGFALLVPSSTELNGENGAGP